MKTSIIIGLLIGAMAFPMIIIPLMGFGIVIWGFYVLIHDIIFRSLHQHTE
ncbi:MAG: hypothetical protein L3J06_07925 [Cyclobacteriaceae bacterium]|nr:hypothetical protein [Cyclobacteriaceae bacterium]